MPEPEPATTARGRILCISFSPLRQDARVQRQIGVLRDFGDVTTIGYGSAPEGAVDHIEIPTSAPSLPQTPIGVLRLALRMYATLPLTAPGEKAALDRAVGHGPYDLVVANDARALPLARALAGSAPILADLHEWAPEENATNLIWRVLVKPYMTWLCRSQLPHMAAVTTVNQSIADLYQQRFGVRAAVVRNAGQFRVLSPSPAEPGRVRLVHSGIAVPGRNVEALIDATLALPARFSLDLYLIGSDAQLAQLRARAGGDPRITFHEPVAPDALPATLNKYDLGVFLLPPRTINMRLMLPNKFFDFVQARLGVVFGPALETDRLIREHGLGVVTRDWSAEALVSSLATLSDDDVAGFKAASHASSTALSNGTDIATLRSVISGLVKAD
ncbi:glycosyltransferase family 4 protein [Salinibacterium sp. ZJ70]|uniref:glycosyltransferase family 4 protein n=1 Tax=Salinibacterium sp. ZJ70 TaxID=2708084 RepID=UPI0014202B51|nr:glycosyltransferase family 4 protein [Salinibacterium sp. ZJ70]